MIWRILPALVCSLLVLLAVFRGASPIESAPELTDPNGAIVPGSYIVLLEPDVNPKEAAHRLDLRTRTYYRAALNGLAASMSAERAAEVSRDPDVASVEPARLMGIGLHENPFQTLVQGIDRVDAEENSGIGIGGAPGPDIDARIAVIDTGIDLDHPDLNVAGGFGAHQEKLGEGAYGDCNSAHGFGDEHGHGTHVSGTAAAVDNNIGVVGIAPGAELYAVRVLRDDGFGCDADVVRGVDWVTERKMEFNDGDGDGDPGIDFTVANMSLGGLPSGALCTAITNSVAEGVMYAVAAGNNSKDASESGPANCANALTVSAFADYDGLPGALAQQVCTWNEATQLDPDDSFAWFSNYGPTVEIAAPGVCIMSTYPDAVYATMSGTSMATPHVAGAAALLKALYGFSGPYDGLSILAELNDRGWTREQNSPCGFSDDPDDTHEPVLYLGSSCTTTTFTPAPTPTPSPTPLPTPTPTPTPTPNPTPTPPPTPTPTPTQTPTPTPPPTPPSSPTPFQGTPAPPMADPADIDCDSQVTGLDSVLLLRFAAELATSLAPGCPPIGAQISPESSTASLRGDVNCDGVVNQQDALYVLQLVAQLIESPGSTCVN